MSRLTNCFTTKFPVKVTGVGRVRITGEARRPSCFQGDGLPDARVPTARVERICDRRPSFSPNRRGWKRFYRWQDWYGRRLSLQAKLCGWHDRKGGR